MRVLYVIQELRAGGAERVVVSLARGAAAAGHSVAVAAAPGPLAGEIEGDRFPLPIVRRRPWVVPAAAAALARAVRLFRPDVVHCHNPAIALATSLATLRGRRPPALASVHGVPDEDYRAAARVLRLAGLPAVACGPGVAAALEEHGLRVATTIVNGIGPAPPPASRDELAAEWGLDRGRRLVLAVGRLVPQKNHGLALRALAEVPGAALVIVGEGPLLGDLRRLAEAEGMADRVVFAGVKPDARALMGAADAVVLPSRWEGLPLVALEAAAAGTPLVATDVRGVRELLADGRDCLLVPPDDPAALARALVRVLEDRELAARLAKAGRELAARYSEEAMVRDFLELYGKIAA